MIQSVPFEGLAEDTEAAFRAQPVAGWRQVRTMPSWPRSWANFSILSLYSHRNAWTNLHLLQGQPETVLASRACSRAQRRDLAGLGGLEAAWRDCDQAISHGP
jgi:hypothetical protein